MPLALRALQNERDEVVNPLGAKGLGEIGLVGVAAAIANAVYHATGRRIRDLPITLDKVLATRGLGYLVGRRDSGLRPKALRSSPLVRSSTRRCERFSPLPARLM